MCWLVSEFEVEQGNSWGACRERKPVDGWTAVENGGAEY